MPNNAQKRLLIILAKDCDPHSQGAQVWPIQTICHHLQSHFPDHSYTLSAVCHSLAQLITLRWVSTVDHEEASRYRLTEQGHAEAMRLREDQASLDYVELAPDAAGDSH